MILSKEEIIANARENKVYAGVYFLVKNNEIVYIGSSFRIEDRIIAHYTKGDFDYYSFVEVDRPTLDDLRSLEAEYILSYKPIHNKTIPSNSKYISINEGLPKELKQISNRHKIKLLKQSGFIFIEYGNSVISSRWYYHFSFKKKIRRCLMLNYEYLEAIQKEYYELKKQLEEL